MASDVVAPEPVDIALGVLLPPSTSVSGSASVDDDGYGEAIGGRGARKHVAEMGYGVLRAAAEAIGREIGFVVGGVVAGIEQHDGKALQAESFGIDDVVLKFGIKATIGAGKAIEALFTASGEATVEVSLTLRRH